MSVEKITDKILSDANKKAEEIVRNAQREQESAITKAKGRVKVLLEQSANEANQEKKQYAARLVSSYQTESKREILEEKNNILDGIFDKALATIEGYDSEKYTSMMVSIALKNIETGKEQMWVDAVTNGKLADNFLSVVNSALKQKGIEQSVTLNISDRKIGHGIVLKRDNIEINAIFSDIIKNQRRTLAGQVTKIIF